MDMVGKVTLCPVVVVGEKEGWSHPLHQKKELLEGDVCAACSAVELQIALNTTLLWDVSGTEGEKEQVHEVDLVDANDQTPWEPILDIIKSKLNL